MTMAISEELASVLDEAGVSAEGIEPKLIGVLERLARGGTAAKDEPTNAELIAAIPRA
jgi:hypothetical protein